MNDITQIRRLKALAKKYARANRVSLHHALDLVAGQLGFPHWNKLYTASKSGWQPDSEQMSSVEVFFARALPQASYRLLEGNEEVEEGTIGDHAYRLQAILHDVLMTGAGWSISVPENPGAVPTVETHTNQDEACPVNDPEFLQAALKIAKDRAVQVRAAIATDWDRRSTKPDREGVVRHPLHGEESAEWFCLKCDGKITGAQIAKYLWHCPGCGASPLNIFGTPFWSDDEGKAYHPVMLDEATHGTDTPQFRLADGRPKLDMTAEKIILLIRLALIEDATNVSEKMGALQADIHVDDEGDVWINFEEDLWPEDKEPLQAIAVAGQLGRDVELGMKWTDIPFAWPGLGTTTCSTADYLNLVLDAYARYESFPENKSQDT